MTDQPYNKIDFFEAKKTLEDFVDDLIQKASENAVIHPIYFDKKTNPFAITHVVESSHFNRGSILDVYDLFSEFYPENNSWTAKGIYQFVNKYHFTHLEEKGEGKRLVSLAVDFSKGATILSNNQQQRKIGPYLSVNFTADYLDTRDLEFNKRLYEIILPEQSLNND